MALLAPKIILRTSQVLLVLLLLSIAGHIGIYYQTEYDLTSPFVPPTLVPLIVRPFLFMAFVSSLCGILSLVLSFFHQYGWSAGVSLATLVWQYLYPSFS